ncbi:hypothetical protein HMI54_015350 [Coelomomyces lativittatus]|nr:hypothetical protein HMI56_000277 [Coelomomyces lativittatus]KAJ1518527.1 hypothetical protein HMI54_015350 [Coelomomyces lativittatus]
MKKKKFNCSTRPASLCGTSYISTTEDRATTSCTSKHSENLNPFHQREAQKTFKKTKDLEPSQDWANIGAYRLAYLQSQNDQLLRRLENVSSPFSPYPPYPVYKSKEYGSPLLSSFKKKRHALERTLYQVYPILIQALHCLDVYSPILSNHSSQSTQEALKNLKQPLSQAIFQCMKYDYETGGLDHEETNVQSLLNVEVCIQEVTKGCTISPQFHEKLKKSLTDRFNKLNSQMDLLRLENQAYKEEREHLCQTVTKETEVFQSEVSKVQDFQKKTQTQLSSISYEMSGLLKQMEQLKLNYSNEDALTMLQVIETLLQRWEPELDELAHLPYVPAIPTTIHSSESSETMQ